MREQYSRAQTAALTVAIARGSLARHMRFFIGGRHV
jgi:hypothetical protein